MVDVEIPKDHVACKLLAKICHTNDVAFFTKLKEEHFSWSARATELYQRIRRRFDMDGRFPTLSGLAELEYAFDIMDLDDTVEHYAERTLDGYLSTKLPKKLESVYNFFEQGDYTRLKETLTECLEVLTTSSLDTQLHVRNFVDLVDEILEESHIAMITNRALVTTTGYTELDELMNGGYRAQNLYVWTGRPKKGKTTYLIHQSVMAWQTGKRVLFLSGEMQAKELAYKLLASTTEVSQADLVQGAVTTAGLDIIREQVSLIAGETKEFLLKTTTSTTTVKDIEMLVIQYKPDILYVDSAHLFKPDSNSYSRLASHEKLADTAQKFKDIALAHAVPVVTSTHLNREAGQGRQRKGNKQARIDESMVSGTDVWSKSATTLFAVDSVDRPDQRKLYMLLNRFGGCKDFLMSFVPDNPNLNLGIIEEIGDPDGNPSQSEEDIAQEIDSWLT